MAEYSDDISLWEEGSKLLCPLLRFNMLLNKWVALDEDPCPTMKCGMRECHNYGVLFHEPNRLIIVRKIRGGWVMGKEYNEEKCVVPPSTFAGGALGSGVGAVVGFLIAGPVGAAILGGLGASICGIIGMLMAFS